MLARVAVCGYRDATVFQAVAACRGIRFDILAR